MTRANVQINRVAEMIVGASKMVVFTGAGVSTESGIPDFRSPGGIWSRFDPDDFTIDKFVGSAETRLKQWKLLIESGLIANAEPNKAHWAIAEFEKLGKLACVITQNIDDLHQKAGNTSGKILELHGNMNRACCLDCRARFDLEVVLRKLRAAPEPPNCEMCGGILKPDVIFFGESLPAEVLTESVRHSRNCDLLIVVGSSLVVYPAAFMPLYAKERGAGLVIINLTATSYDDMADVVIHEKAGEAMEKILGAVRARL